MRSKLIDVRTFSALLLCVAACGDGGSSGPDGGGNAPRVTNTTPAVGATMVIRNTSVSATFSEAMDRSTLDATSFTLTVGSPPVAVAGTVVPTDTMVVFWPSTRLVAGTEYTATITTAAHSAAQVALESPHTWSFSTGSVLGTELAVNLGTAGDFVILAKSGITTVPTSIVTGDLGVSPIAASAIIGFDLTADATNVFSRSAQVTGKVFAADYAPPTPSNMTTSISDMETAFTDAAARAPDQIDLGAGMIGTVTLAPGVYKWGTGLLIPTSIMLDGPANGVWIFQIAGDLTVANGVNMTLAGGAQAKHIFWQVSGEVLAGTTAHLEGIFLSQTAVTLDTGASVNGRLMAQTAVTIRGSTVVEP